MTDETPDLPERQLLKNVPLQDKNVRVPFAYEALATELRLFKSKAGIEKDMMESLKRNTFKDLDAQVDKATKVIASLKEDLDEYNKAWREHAISFLTKLIADTTTQAEQQKVAAAASEPSGDPKAA